MAACLALAVPVTCAAAEAQYGPRGQAVFEIVKKWGGHVEEAYHTNAGTWAKAMGPVFNKSSTETLERAANARTFDAMNDVLLTNGKPTMAKAAAGTVGPMSLGDTASDLVFVPVTPCRIFDTRLAGGAIAANTVRSFDVTAVADYTFQGGATGDCNGVGSAGSFAAAAINFTVVTPGAAGYITAFPYLGTQPLAATVNYTAGDIRGNTAIVKLDQGASANELSVYTYAQTHLVADIIGYFITPAATALDCVDTTNVVVSVAAGGTTNVAASACPAGYMPTATNCEAGSWDMPFVYSHGGICSAKNNGGSAAEARASRTCCRVPGR